MSSQDKVELQGGSGPEYEYPTTEKDEPVPVVGEGEEQGLMGTPVGPVDTSTEDVTGKKETELSDDAIAQEEEREQQEAGTFTEDMTKNTKQPGEGTGPDEDPDYVPGQE
ncbi:hypothetical protein KFL_000140120 [Klebsormidium nitens]|uniref:Uncharacterized protein n=1 Tax=Klebsormidium nitens TaxID=105231 RepID=A0A1Y1HKL2_KLENI|nr:hypothetical protein KFL_000140120 [Klebsormidium nitens]|eukprot:GAQ78493.1 hypothetical protein KFL_000140120 [Klebsormidium nitens]